MTSLTEHAVSAYSRTAINRLGIWMFFAGETFLFGAIISTRYYLQGVHRPDELNQMLGLILTAILLLSSLTAYRAEVAAANGDSATFKRNMLYTIVMGLVFMVGVGYEWFEALSPHHGDFPPSTAFGSVFFTTTGIHATHVFSGIVMLGIVFLLGRKEGRYTANNYWGVEGVVKYWHFIDVAWVFIYPTLYLV